MRRWGVILLGWYFFVAWEGRVTRWEFGSEKQCQEARGEVVKALNASHFSGHGGEKVTRCLYGNTL